MKSILIVEDVAKVREMIKEYLTEDGYLLTTADNGLKALEIVQAQRPAIIVLDGLLPQLNGFELARLIRSLDPSYQPRIVMVTGVYTKQAYRNDAKLKYGIDEFVTKPFTQKQLNERVYGTPQKTEAA